MGVGDGGVTAASLGHVAPVYDLPTFCTYDVGTDTVVASGFDTTYDEAGLTAYNGGTPVTNATELQAAIDSCAASASGWLIRVQAETDYANLVLKARPSTSAGWIYIRPADAAYATLPAASGGTTSGGAANRVRPSDAAAMWRCTTANGGVACLTVPAEASTTYCRYRLIGAHFQTTASGGTNELVNFDRYALTSEADLPRELVFDRCYMKGSLVSGAGTNYGFWFDVQDAAILDSWIEQVGTPGHESKPLAFINGNRLKVTNCYINGGAIHVLVGGGTPKLPSPYLPSDLFFDRCHFHRPPTWNPYHPSYTTAVGAIKNNFELKFAKRVCVQDCVLEQAWTSGQQSIVNIKTEATANEPTPQTTWATTRDVVLRHLLVAGCYGGVDLGGNSNGAAMYDDFAAQQTQRVELSSVVISAGTALDYGGAIDNRKSGLFISDLHDYTIRNVTIVAPAGGWYWGIKLNASTTGSRTLMTGTWENVVVCGGDATSVLVIDGILDDSYQGVTGKAIFDLTHSSWSGSGWAVLTEQNYSAGQITALEQLNTTGLPRATAAVVELGTTTAVVTDLAASDPGAGNYTVVHPSFGTAGTAGGAPGAVWATLARRLAGVRETTGW